MTHLENAHDLPPLVQRAILRLIRAFAPERIVLFGSHAKGRVHIRSDVDLLLTAKFDDRRFFHQRRARQLAGDSFPRMDIVLAAPEEIAEAPAAKSPFLQSILSTGITIYQRQPSDEN